MQYHYKTKTDLLSGLMVWYVAENKHALLQTMNELEGGLRALIKFVLSAEADSDEIKLSLAIASCAERAALTNQFAAFYYEFYALLADFLGVLQGNRLKLSVFRQGRPCSDGY